MFFFTTLIAGEIMLHKLAADRFNALTPDQQKLELRKREVRALERMAEAKEEANRIARNRFW